MTGKSNLENSAMANLYWNIPRPLDRVIKERSSSFLLAHDSKKKATLKLGKIGYIIHTEITGGVHPTPPGLHGMTNSEPTPTTHEVRMVQQH